MMPSLFSMEMVCRFNTERAKFAIDCNRRALKTNRDWLDDPGLPLPDPVTMAIALDPAVCTRRSAHYVDVACTDEVTRGMTVVDQLGVSNKEPNIEVCGAIDVALWKETLYRTLR